MAQALSLLESIQRPENMSEVLAKQLDGLVERTVVMALTDVER